MCCNNKLCTIGVPIYDDVINILNKNKALKLFLTKGYRSSYEINEFTQGILGQLNNASSFERHEASPLILSERAL